MLLQKKTKIFKFYIFGETNNNYRTAAIYFTILCYGSVGTLMKSETSIQICCQRLLCFALRLPDFQVTHLLIENESLAMTDTKQYIYSTVHPLFAIKIRTVPQIAT